MRLLVLHVMPENNKHCGTQNVAKKNAYIQKLVTAAGGTVLVASLHQGHVAQGLRFNVGDMCVHVQKEARSAAAR
jgi:hypothetical protein